MPVKDGFYTDGYFIEGEMQTLSADGYLAIAQDTDSFVYLYQLGQPIATFTGEVSPFAKAKRKRRTVNLDYYVNGAPGNGVYNLTYYLSGLKASGCPTNPNQFSASPTNILYKAGVPYTGEICREEETSSLPANLPNRQTIVNSITSLWIGYWPNGDATVTTILTGGGSYLQPYWDFADAPKTTNIMLSGGLPANGLMVDRAGDRFYANGVLLSPLYANNMVDGRLFRNGVAFKGTLTVTNSAVSWNGQTINISHMLVPSAAVPLSGLKTFTNGILNQGLINNTYFINGTKYESQESADLDISGLRVQTTALYKGVAAIGVFDNVYYVSGERGTGLNNNVYYSNGDRGTNIYLNVYYSNGDKANGVHNNVYYINGATGTGVYNNVYYISGDKATGNIIYNGTYYFNGDRGTGLYNDIYYVKGLLGSGSPSDAQIFAASPNNVLYKNGTPYTGEFVSKQQVGGAPLVASNWIGFWPNGDTTVSTMPTAHNSFVTNSPKIVSGRYQYSLCLALKNDGSVIGWGTNYSGSYPSQATVSSGVIDVAVGGTHSLALKNNGSVIGWGTNGAGQISIPSAALSGVISIAAGGTHSLALKNNGSVIGWGRNLFGQISIPPAALSGVISIAAGSDYSLALKNNGSVIGWGTNGAGQISIPSAALSDVISIAAGSNHSLALKNDGSVIGWGNNFAGQTTIPSAALSGVVAIAAGSNNFDHYSLAIKADGRIIGWGGNLFGPITIPANLWTNLMEAKPIGSSLWLQPYWDIAGVPNTTTLLLSGGKLANGVYNNITYVNGVSAA